jgi:hypothetical protein
MPVVSMSSFDPCAGLVSPSEPHLRTADPINMYLHEGPNDVAGLAKTQSRWPLRAHWPTFTRTQAYSNLSITRSLTERWAVSRIYLLIETRPRDSLHGLCVQ